MRAITRAFAAASLMLLAVAATPAGALEAGVVCQICTGEALPVVEAPPSSPLLYLLQGTLSLRVGELRNVQGGNAEIALDLAARTWELSLGDDLVYSGHLAPKGKSGRKFTMFLDDESHEEFMELIAGMGERLAAVFSLDVLGDTTTMVMQLDADGAPSVKLKSRVLMTGPSEFVVKLKLAPRD